MSHRLPDEAMDQLFFEARTYRAWQDRPVEQALLRQLHDTLRWGPTSMNCCPLRIQFVISAEAKTRLQPCLAKGNVDKTMSAPATAILGYDTRFEEHLAVLVPSKPRAAEIFRGEAERGYPTAFRNSSLQGGYFILAARALGLDCGPMSGFDADGVDAEFWPDGRVRTNFLCNIGYGDGSALRPRQPRFEFDDICAIL